MSAEIHQYDALQKFLESRFRTLEILAKNTVKPTAKRETKSFHISNNEIPNYSCSICKNGNHAVRLCTILFQADVNSRIKMIQERKLCKISFAYSHNNTEV